MIAATLRHKSLISIMLRSRKLSPIQLGNLIHHRNQMNIDSEGQTLLHIVTFQGMYSNFSFFLFFKSYYVFESGPIPTHKQMV